MCGRNARLEPAHDRQPMISTSIEYVQEWSNLSLHRHRDENIRSETDLNPGEAGACHADNRQRRTVHSESLIQNTRISPEAAGPITVAQHDDWMSAWNTIILLGEEPTQGWLHAEDIEI